MISLKVLEIRNLSKKFGANYIINDLNMSLNENSILGFVGKNGAGKTTTMKMILGLLKPDKGEIYVCGEKVSYGETKTNRFIGYLPDVPEFYGYMTPVKYLKLCADITGISKNEIDKKIEKLLKLVGLYEHKNKRISGFSRGMKQRLGIAQALLNEPKLLICDEPTSALDPIGRREILDILREVKEKTTVIFSTHILSDVEDICDEVALLQDGKIALSGNIFDIKSRHIEDCIEIEFKNNGDELKFLEVFEYENIKVKGNNVFICSKDIEKIQRRVMEIFISKDIYPISIKLCETDLERLFLEAIK